MKYCVYHHHRGNKLPPSEAPQRLVANVYSAINLPRHKAGQALPNGKQLDLTHVDGLKTGYFHLSTGGFCPQQ